jgi:hypothetical protein
MPGVGKTAQAIVATRRLEDSLHASMMTILPSLCKTMAPSSLAGRYRPTAPAKLENGGRAAVIVPDGILFGSSNAHVDIRRKLIEENRLEGVVSMPAGVFRPYAGVSTAVLLFTKGGTTDKIWFYEARNHEGLI